MTSSRWQLLLADAVLAAHAGFVLFVVGGLIAIWIGAARGWSWIRTPWFRLAHLVAIAFVVAESLAGMICPLTSWEDALRRMGGGEHRYEGSFMQHWLHRLMFFSWPEWVFTILYVTFLGAVALTWWKIPPNWRRTRRNQPRCAGRS